MDPLGVNVIGDVTEGTVQIISINVNGASASCCAYSIERADAGATNWSPISDERFSFDNNDASTTLRVIAVSTDINYIYRIKVVDGGDTAYSPDSFSFDVTVSGIVGRNLVLPSQGKGRNFKVYWTPPGVNYQGFPREVYTAVHNSVPLYLTLENPSIPVTGGKLIAQRRLGHNSHWYRLNNFVQVDFSSYNLPTAQFDNFRQKLQDTFVPALRTADGNPTGNYKVETIRRIVGTQASTFLIFYARSYDTGVIVPAATLLTALQSVLSTGVAWDPALGTGAVGTPTAFTPLSYNIIRSTTSISTSTTASYTISLSSSTPTYTLGNAITTSRQISWTPNPYYGAAIPAGDQWTLEAVGGNSDDSYAVPFRGKPLYRFKTASGFYIKINNDYSDVSGFATVSGTNTVGDATTFAVGNDKDSLYYLTDGVESGQPGSENAWSSAPCDNSAVDNCKIVDNAPQYRRLEVDLGGDFAITSFISLWDFYAISGRQNLAGGASASSVAWGGNNLRGFPNNAVSSLGYNFELWLKSSDEADFEDYTGAASLNDYNTCVSQRSPLGTICRIEFTVANYARLTYNKFGNFRFRYARIVMDGLVSQIESSVSSFYRVFTARDFQIVGGCSCNGHSYNCDLETGSCSPAGTAGCQHNTVGQHCDTCAFGYFVNYANKPITDPLDTVYTNSTATETYSSPLSPGIVYTVTLIDGPLLVDLTYAGLAENADPAAGFDAYFHGGGPCVNCFCYGHDSYTLFKTGRGCDQITGECDCDASTKTDGHNCEVCADGACRLSDKTLYDVCEACQCNGHSTSTTSTGADFCDKSTCGCSCDPADNVEGLHCESCKAGHYSATGNGESGVDCSPCFCNGHTFNGAYETCDVTGGNCDQESAPCQGNTRGNQCQYCDEGYYRPVDAFGNVDLSADCVLCSCHGLADPRTYTTASANDHTAICDPHGGVCNCRANENVQGDHCEACLSGYFSPVTGLDNVGCDACECNGHKTGNVCNALGGECNENYSGAPEPCEDNTTGSHCELCKDTFYRPCHGGSCDIDLTDGCGPCTCNEHSHNAFGVDTCNPNGGVCTCDASSNSEGDHCESCKANTWNSFGNSQDGRDCSPCECYGHSSTCNNFGICSNCVDNTEGDHCEECTSAHKRSTPIDPLLLDDTLKEAARYDTCTACTCNGHATDCNAWTGECIDCTGDTENDAWAAGPFCNRCKADYYRQLAGLFTPDECNACGYNGGSCSTQTLIDSCSSCASHCFGGITSCDEVTGQCHDCASVNAQGPRCESCLPGYFGDPVNGVPCTPCSDACYHSTPRVWTREDVIGPALKCESTLHGTARECVYNHLSSSVLCSCPRSNPGLHETLDDIPLYRGATCDRCNSQGFFGTPTVCADGSGSGLGTCTQFNECHECGCNGNIDEAQFRRNCGTSADPTIATCFRCEGGTTGDNCEVCEPGKYGDATNTAVAGIYPGYPVDAAGNNLKCFNCDCNGRATVRVGGNPTVSTSFDTCDTTGPNVGDYTCSCQYPYVGPTCRECARGYEPMVDTTNGTDSAPGYVYCKPCPSCVLALYSQGIVPLEADASVLASDYDQLNNTVVQLEKDVAEIETHITRRRSLDSGSSAAVSAEYEAQIKSMLEEAKAAVESAVTNNEMKVADAENKLETLSNSVKEAIVSIRAKLSQVDVQGKLNPATAQVAEIAAKLTQTAAEVEALKQSVRDFESRSSSNILAHLTRLVAAEASAEKAASAIEEFKTQTSSRLEELTPLARSLAAQVASVSESFTALSASIHSAVEEKNRLIDEKIASVSALDTLVSESLASVKAFTKNADEVQTRVESMRTTIQALVDGARASKANVDQRLSNTKEEIEAATRRVEAVKSEVNALVEAAKDKLGNGVETMSKDFAARLEALRSAFLSAVETEKSAHKSSALEISNSVAEASQQAHAKLASHTEKLADFERQLKGIQIAMDGNVADFAAKLSATVSHLSSVVRDASTGQFVLPEQFGYFVSHANSEMDNLKVAVTSRVSKMDAYLKSAIAGIDGKLLKARSKAESDMSIVRAQAQFSIETALRDVRAVIASVRAGQTSAIAASESRITALIASAEQIVVDGVSSARQETVSSINSIKAWTEDRVSHLQSEVAAKAVAFQATADSVQEKAKAIAEESIATVSERIAAKREETLQPLRAELAAALKSVAEISASLSSLESSAKRISTKIQSVEADNALARKQLKNLQDSLQTYLSANNGNNKPVHISQMAVGVGAATAAAAADNNNNNKSGNSDLLLKVALPATGFVALVALIVAGVFFRKYRNAVNRRTSFEY